jgi:2-polyprenyl-3-methyl-5-hydroxy-6-metoxy-1,4-benzoquinol methylase
MLSREEVSKTALVEELCRGRSVLDLGCIDHSAETALALGHAWLHARIARVARSCVGVDVLADEARALNERGYDIRVADVEQLSLDATFEVIVAGDLIEHLSNIGTFLEAVSQHMDSTSVFIVTTPNPYNIEQVANGVFRNKTFVNEEHTVAIDPKAMYQLVARSPLAVADFRWVDTRFHFSLERVVARHLVNPTMSWIMRRRPLVRRDYAVLLVRR